MFKRIKGWLISLTAAVLLTVVIMLADGITAADNPVDVLRIISDGFSLSGLLLLCVGGLVWISSQGALDMLTYAIKKGAHMILPGAAKSKIESFYDYKTRRDAKKTVRGCGSILLVGLVFLVIGIVLIAILYQVAGW